MFVVELSVTAILDAVVDVTDAVKVPLTVRFGIVKVFVVPSYTRDVSIPIALRPEPTADGK